MENEKKAVVGESPGCDYGRTRGSAVWIAFVHALYCTKVPEIPRSAHRYI